MLLKYLWALFHALRKFLYNRSEAAFFKMPKQLLKVRKAIWFSTNSRCLLFFLLIILFLDRMIYFGIIWNVLEILQWKSEGMNESQFDF